MTSWSAVRELRRTAPVDFNNRLFVFAWALTPAVAGSVVSILLWMCLVWAPVRALLMPLDYRLSPLDRRFAWLMTSYGVVHVGFSLAMGGLAAVTPLLAVFLFFSPWLLVPRLRITPEAELLPLLACGAACGAILAALLGIAQYYLISFRAAGGAGNESIFGLAGAVLAGAALSGALLPGRKLGLLGLAGFVAGSVCVFLSGTRGVWILPIVHGAIVLVLSAGRLRWKTVIGLVVAAITLSASLYAVFSPAIDRRIAAMENNIARMEQLDDYDTSIGHRILLLRGGWEAVKERPLTGYGIVDRMPAALSHLPDNERALVGYSHPHNGFLSALLDAGIPGLLTLLAALAAPLVAAFGAARDPQWRARCAVALTLVASYAIAGSTNLIFGNDIANALFVAFALVIAASTPFAESAKPS